MHVGATKHFGGAAAQLLLPTHAPTMSLVDVVANSAGTIVAGVLTGAAAGRGSTPGRGWGR